MAQVLQFQAHRMGK